MAPGIDDSAIPDAMTRAQLAELRGGLDGSWEGAAVAPQPNGAVQTKSVSVHAPRLCAGGCGTTLTGRPEQKWCSTACRKRFAYAQRKTAGPVAAPLPPPVHAPASNGAAPCTLSEVLGAVFQAGGVLEFNAGGLVLVARAG